MTDVITIGSATVDHFMTIEQPFSSIKAGDKILIKNAHTYSGGSASNAAAALSMLGLNVKMLAKLGEDHDAEFIVQEMKRYQVKNICMHRSKHHTDFSTIMSSTKEKDRIIYTFKEASRNLEHNDFRKQDLDASWLYIGSLMGKSFTVGAKIVKDTEMSVLFNPSLYLARQGKKFLAPILQKTKILVLNLEEAQAVLKINSIKMEALLLGLHALGPEIVIITNGEKRLYALSNDTIYSLLPPKVKIVHTAGAGDAFTAGFLAGLIKKYSFEDALRLGQVNASSVIQHIGCKNKLLTEKEGKVLMKKHKIKIENKRLK
ncbi:MAG: carbohydrate kinase family protein [Nanoarchaeota archaeon]|nr:carbohydrate kinase family protein [Nanoarchaeota archaeon]